MPDAATIFTDHWAQCGFCQEGLPCADGDPLWEVMHMQVLDEQGRDPDA